MFQKMSNFNIHESQNVELRHFKFFIFFNIKHILESSFSGFCFQKF